MTSAHAGDSKSKKKVVAISFQPDKKAKSKKKSANKSTKKSNVVTYHYSQRNTDEVQIEPLTNGKKTSKYGLKKIVKKKSKKRAVASSERGPDNVNQIGNSMPEKNPIDLPAAKKEINKKELQSYLKNMRGFDEDNLDSEIDSSL